MTSTPLSMHINWCLVQNTSILFILFSLKYVIAHVFYSYCRTLLPLNPYDIQHILPSKMCKYVIASPSHLIINKPFFYFAACFILLANWSGLAWMNMTGTDFFVVLAVVLKRPLNSFLQVHETFLDPPSTWFGTICPAGPRLHPTTYRQEHINPTLVSHHHINEQIQPTLLVVNNCITTRFAMSPSLSSNFSCLLLCFAVTLSEFAFLPLNSFWTGVTPKLWLQLDHPSPDGVAFTARLVAFIPVRPIRDHAVNGWIGTLKK